MIKRPRHLVSEPLSLQSEVATDEYANALRHYTSGNTTSYEKFKIYKSNDVKEQLEKLFHSKCAYCESDYKTSGDINVEHFRPKGRIKLANGSFLTPGYWWLASKWENLLPSCRNCNIVHKYNINGTITRLGKGNFFPLPIIDSWRRVPIQGIETSEVPLLINPTEEDPKEFIYFQNSLSRKYSIVKALNTNDHVNLKGKSSIQYYALNRPSLVSARTSEILKLGNALLAIENNIDDLLSANTFIDKRKYVRRINKNLKNIFDNYLNVKQPYLQAKLSYFMDWIQQYPEIYIDRILKHIDVSI